MELEESKSIETSPVERVTFMQMLQKRLVSIVLASERNNDVLRDALNRTINSDIKPLLETSIPDVVNVYSIEDLTSQARDLQQEQNELLNQLKDIL